MRRILRAICLVVLFQFHAGVILASDDTSALKHFNTAGEMFLKDNETLQQRADNGDIDAAYQRGLRSIIPYLLPSLGEGDADKAMHYLNIAAEKGHVMASAALGHVSFLGPIFNQQPFYWEEVQKHHTKAAKAGVADSINALAMMHFLGKSTDRPSFPEVGDMFLDAAKKGSVSAHANIATIWGLLPKAVLEEEGFILPDNYVQIAFAHAVYAAENNSQLGNVMANHIAATYPDVADKSLVKLDRETGVPNDPNLRLMFDFKVTPNQILFNDADLNIMYEAKMLK